jgi:hypothetical protein
MNVERLEQLNQSNALPAAVQRRIAEVLSEDPEYAADELVELCEAILSQLAAIATAAYIGQERQKEMFNDIILQWFSSPGHQNAGPMYRWSAHFIKRVTTKEADQIRGLFWEEDGETLRDTVNRLSSIRNKVMHGFFVLPPEENLRIAEQIADVLEEMVRTDVFNVLQKASYNFLDQEPCGVAFSGAWRAGENDWEALSSAHALGATAQDIREQLSDRFYALEQSRIAADSSAKAADAVAKASDFIRSAKKGAVVFWTDPHHSSDSDFASVVEELGKSAELLTVNYGVQKSGVTFTRRFLKHQLLRRLVEETGQKDISRKDTDKAIRSLMGRCTKRVVLVLHNVHTALFNDEHLLNEMDFLYELGITTIAFAHEHSYLKRFFNKEIPVLRKETVHPKQETLEAVMNNYLRFKGPGPEDEDPSDYRKLQEITASIIGELRNNKEVVARRFADSIKAPIEYVHECFEILRPFYAFKTLEFQKDEIDELYGFPKELTESSAIFLALGRRDARLEYKHKVLTP